MLLPFFNKTALQGFVFYQDILFAIYCTMPMTPSIKGPVVFVISSCFRDGKFSVQNLFPSRSSTPSILFLNNVEQIYLTPLKTTKVPPCHEHSESTIGVAVCLRCLLLLTAAKRNAATKKATSLTDAKPSNTLTLFVLLISDSIDLFTKSLPV